MRIVVLTALLGLSVTEAASCSGAWGQCGGNNWQGSTCCVDGYTCKVTNEWYSQCIPGSSPTTTAPVPSTTSPVPTTTQPVPTTSQPSPTTTQPTPTQTTAQPTPSTTSTPAPTVTTSPTTYLTYDTTTVAAHDQAPYPATTQTCGSWKLVDNVCCANYCSTNNQSQSCDADCTGKCVSPPAADCKSGTMWGEKTSVSDAEAWHYSRSTHFGLTAGGACGFGLYALCTKGSKTAAWTDPMLAEYQCDAFCKAYPALCQDPSNTTLRGNFAAPNGDYYTQFWPHLEGDRDNYLSCGECFELVRTKADGTDYAPGEAGYTDPITLEVIDSCPCSANSKWCCGSGDDHCAEINYKYGCPIPKDSHHLDLSDIAMGRLQGGGKMVDGVIPTRYRRVPCPKPGNIYIWLREKGEAYYFAFSVVNTAGVGSVTKVEVKGAGSSTWTKMIHDPNYTPARAQERYGSWTTPQGSGPFNLPVAIRITSPNGEQVVNEQAIKSFAAPTGSIPGYNYIDLGVQFTKFGKH